MRICGIKPFFVLLWHLIHKQMEEQRPLILLSNDDGVQAKGINVLMEGLTPLADVLVVAPDGPRSGAACSITPYAPVRVYTLSQRPGLTVCACSGTPVDCIKMALERVAPRTPSLVVAGINHGDNASVNVHYSGTMGAVIEGCLKGIPSVGFSLCDFDPDADFSPCLPYVQRVVRQVLAQGLPQGVCLNVNFPVKAPYAGLKVCRMARGVWTHEWCEHTHPRGGKYYWLTGQYASQEPGTTDPLADATALAQGYVALTPTQVDVTAYGMIDTLKVLENE